MRESSKARSPFAADPDAHGGRLHPEPESAERTAYQRDRDRIIHSSAFRRLQFKTQVFIVHEGDHYRTRLTHTLEVAQIARSVARRLGLDEDLAEACALAHDLGHPPFGHAGERELDALMEGRGGFDHNAQTLRVLTKLERRYAAFDGMNLSWATLEGVVKHNGPLTAARGRTPAPPVVEYDAEHDLALDHWPSAEAQIAALADDAAYTAHDLDDGLRADLFAVEDLAEEPLVRPIFDDVRDRHPLIEPGRLAGEVTRRLIGLFVDDLAAETARRIARAGCRNAADIRALREGVAGFSAKVAAERARLQRFLFERMYRHRKVNRAMSAARRVIRDLFGVYEGEPEVMPETWRARHEAAHGDARARVVCDYIAGMTDRFALAEHAKLIRAEDW